MGLASRIGGGAGTDTEIHGWCMVADIPTFGSSLEKVDLAPIVFQCYGTLVEVNVESTDAPSGSDLQIEIKRQSDGQRMFTADGPGALVLPVNSTGIVRLKTFITQDISYGDKYELWCAGGSGARNVHIQVEAVIKSRGYTESS